MKIALCGARSTGKTTLAKELSKVLNIPYLPEVGRKILDTYPVGTKPCYEIQEKITNLQIETEDSMEEFISCRSRLDVAAFNNPYNTLYEKALETIPYDLLIYIPIIHEIPFRHDNVRGKNPADRFDENNNIIDVLLEVLVNTVGNITRNLSCWTMEAKKLEDRVSEVTDFLERRNLI